MKERKRILVVEDEAHLGALFEFVLESAGGFLTRVVNSGCRAVATARNFLPHLIVLDLNIPGRHGSEVLAELRADPNLEGIPVVVMSGSLASHETPSPLFDGLRFLAKPFTHTDLLACAAEMTVI